MTDGPYYRHDLALVHERGYGHHAENCAPGVLALLEPVRGGLVLEIGCGAGALTRHLVATGHRVLATDICDLEWGAARVGASSLGLTGPDWAIITAFSMPAADTFVRDITTFVPDGNGAWRRDSERHSNVLVDTSRIPGLMTIVGVRD